LMLTVRSCCFGKVTLWLACLAICLGFLSACSQLGAFNAVISKDDATRVARDVTYGPDPRQRLDIYAPPKGRTVRGTVVFVYGGSWDSGAKEDYSFVGRAFANNGYTTAVIDYRLVPRIRYPAFVQDTAKAVAWTVRNISEYGGNPDRVFLIGHSAGAYNTVMTAIAPEFLRAEGLEPSALSGAVGLSGPYDFLPLDVEATREAFGGVRNLETTQPVNIVNRGRASPPIFLATGLRDETVMPKNSEALGHELKAAGKIVELREYPDLSHVGTLLALSKPFRGRAPVLHDVLKFMENH
jgi:acetyl esterase/lipase